MTSGSAGKKEQTGEFAKKVHLGGSKTHSANSTDVMELSRTVVDDVPSRDPLCVSKSISGTLQILKAITSKSVAL